MTLDAVYSVMGPDQKRYYFSKDNDAKTFARNNRVLSGEFGSEDSDDNEIEMLEERESWRKQPYFKMDGAHYIMDKGELQAILIDTMLPESETTNHYMYEIVASETKEHLGIFSTLKKAKDTVNDLLQGIKGNMIINRIPIDTVSYFDPDFVWETLRHDS